MNEKQLMLTRAHLKNMSQVSAAVGTRDLNPLHAERIVLMSLDFALHIALWCSMRRDSQESPRGCVHADTHSGQAGL